jgi:hypothetical protein
LTARASAGRRSLLNALDLSLFGGDHLIALGELLERSVALAAEFVGLGFAIDPRVSVRTVPALARLLALLLKEIGHLELDAALAAAH